MARPADMMNWFGNKDCTAALAEFSGAAGRANRIGKLKKNPSVGGDREIAEIIADNCEVLCFRKGDAFIKQGDIGDDVFYILAGEANIVLNKRKITYREAPTQVGEMAARSGKGRTATVSARSDLLVVAKLSGEKFREIEASFPNFKERLSVELEARFRERLTAQKVYAEGLAPIWTIASIVVGIGTAVLTWYVSPDNWESSLKVATAFLAGVAFFMVAMIANPAYRWRNLATLVGASMVGYVFLGRHISITADGANFANARLELISQGAEQSDFAFSITILALLIIFAVSAAMDWLHSRS